MPRSSSQRITPDAASSPNALPPPSNTACTCSTLFSGDSRSVSRVPGAPPRTSTPATAPAPHSTTLQPVGRRGSVKWPTVRPAMSQIEPPFMRSTVGAHRPVVAAQPAGLNTRSVDAGYFASIFAGRRGRAPTRRRNSDRCRRAARSRNQRRRCIRRCRCARRRCRAAARDRSIRSSGAVAASLVLLRQTRLRCRPSACSPRRGGAAYRRNSSRCR